MSEGRIERRIVMVRIRREEKRINKGLRMIEINSKKTKVKEESENKWEGKRMRK
jgi:hypothetical protein